MNYMYKKLTLLDRVHKVMIATLFVLVVIIFSSCSTSTLLDDIGQREVAKILRSEQQVLSVYIHGAGDTPFVWAIDKIDRFGGVALDWSESSMGKLSAPKKGYEIGLTIGSLLKGNMNDMHLILIAHSAGAWVAQGIADGIGNENGIEIVFLDPFTAASIVQPFAGSKRLGNNASRVSTYYTTIDPIPFTAGKVSSGEVINLDSYITVEGKKSEAHWSVIDIYFNRYGK
ncbi:MAG: alpha/beta hydrolase [Spirochaetia bacterium]|nr:alpha/beta hydrolase [Spirochaetia bacterium]